MSVPLISAHWIAAAQQLIRIFVDALIATVTSKTGTFIKVHAAFIRERTAVHLYQDMIR